MIKLREYSLILLALLLAGGCTQSGDSVPLSSHDTRQDAGAKVQQGRSVLAPVYGPLAEHIVAEFGLEKKTGIGIDVGSGPGTLIIELCKRTQLHWINADINPHVFAPFYSQAAKHGFGHRVSALYADAQALPFRSNYADIIVSRGSFHFWEDKVKAFGQIYRVLKPGATAYIGRGFSENLPLATAKEIRTKQRGRITYSVEDTADELRQIMDDLGIKGYRIHRPRADTEVNYGVWIEFHKARE